MPDSTLPPLPPTTPAMSPTLPIPSPTRRPQRRPCPSQYARLWDRLLHNAETKSQNNTKSTSNSKTTPPTSSFSFPRSASAARTARDAQGDDFTYAPRKISDEHLRLSFEHAVVNEGLTVFADFDLPVQPPPRNTRRKSTPSVPVSKRTRPPTRTRTSSRLLPPPPALPPPHPPRAFRESLSQPIRNSRRSSILSDDDDDDDNDSDYIEIVPTRPPSRVRRPPTSTVVGSRFSDDCPSSSFVHVPPPIPRINIPISQLPPSDLPLLKQKAHVRPPPSNQHISVRDRLRIDEESEKFSDAIPTFPPSNRSMPVASPSPQERRCLSKMASPPRTEHSLSALPPAAPLAAIVVNRRSSPSADVVVSPHDDNKPSLSHPSPSSQVVELSDDWAVQTVPKASVAGKQQDGRDVQRGKSVKAASSSAVIDVDALPDSVDELEEIIDGSEGPQRRVGPFVKPRAIFHDDSFRTFKNGEHEPVDILWIPPKSESKSKGKLKSKLKSKANRKTKRRRTIPNVPGDQDRLGGSAFVDLEITADLAARRQKIADDLAAGPSLLKASGKFASEDEFATKQSSHHRQVSPRSRMEERDSPKRRSSPSFGESKPLLARNIECHLVHNSNETEEYVLDSDSDAPLIPRKRKRRSSKEKRPSSVSEHVEARQEPHDLDAYFQDQLQLPQLQYLPPVPRISKISSGAHGVKPSLSPGRQAELPETNNAIPSSANWNANANGSTTGITASAALADNFPPSMSTPLNSLARPADDGSKGPEPKSLTPSVGQTERQDVGPIVIEVSDSGPPESVAYASNSTKPSSTSDSSKLQICSVPATPSFGTPSPAPILDTTADDMVHSGGPTSSAGIVKQEGSCPDEVVEIIPGKVVDVEGDAVCSNGVVDESDYDNAVSHREVEFDSRASSDDGGNTVGIAGSASFGNSVEISSADCARGEGADLEKRVLNEDTVLEKKCENPCGKEPTDNDTINIMTVEQGRTQGKVGIGNAQPAMRVDAGKACHLPAMENNVIEEGKENGIKSNTQVGANGNGGGWSVPLKLSLWRRVGNLFSNLRLIGERSDADIRPPATVKEESVLQRRGREDTDDTHTGPVRKKRKMESSKVDSPSATPISKDNKVTCQFDMTRIVMENAAKKTSCVADKSKDLKEGTEKTCVSKGDSTVGVNEEEAMDSLGQEASATTPKGLSSPGLGGMWKLDPETKVRDEQLLPNVEKIRKSGGNGRALTCGDCSGDGVDGRASTGVESRDAVDAEATSDNTDVVDGRKRREKRSGSLSSGKVKVTLHLRIRKPQKPVPP